MPVIHLRSESAVFLWNGTEKNFAQTDFCLAFFGSGSYKILKANQEVPAKGVLLEFKDSSDQIVLNGVIQTISEAVNTMRVKKPDCKICYYQIEDGESVQNFSLKQTHKVVFVRKDEEQQVLAKHNVASQVPFNDRSSCVKLLWHMRWCQKGLTPVKPALHVVGALSLPPAHGLKLHR